MDIMDTFIAFLLITPLVCLPLYVVITLKIFKEDVSLSDFLIMTFISIIPFVNLITLLIYTFYAYRLYLNSDSIIVFKAKK